MKSFKRVAPYLLIATLLPLAGCPFPPGRHDDRGGDHQQGPGRDHPDNGRHDDRGHDDGNQHPGSDRDH